MCIFLLVLHYFILASLVNLVHLCSVVHFVVLVIAGVTSVGKTELSLRLAALLKGEVISADSVQV